MEAEMFARFKQWREKQSEKAEARRQIKETKAALKRQADDEAYWRIGPAIGIIAILSFALLVITLVLGAFALVVIAIITPDQFESGVTVYFVANTIEFLFFCCSAGAYVQYCDYFDRKNGMIP